MYNTFDGTGGILPKIPLPKGLALFFVRRGGEEGFFNQQLARRERLYYGNWLVY